MKNNFFDYRNRRSIKTDYAKYRYKRMESLTIPIFSVLETDDNAMKMMVSSTRSKVLLKTT